MATARPVPPVQKRTGTVPSLMFIVTALVLLALFLRYADGSLNGYRLQLVVLVAINAMVAISLTMSNGFTGVFSLGQVGFLAVGAYTGTLISLAPQWKQPNFLPGLPGWLASFDSSGWPDQLSLLFACVVGGLVAAAVGLVIGGPLMRLSGHYVAVATMGFLIIVQAVAINWSDVTRGARGLSQIPTYTNVWAAYGWAVATIYAAWRIRNSPFGRSMIASRENLIAARAIGVNVHRSRLLAFVMAAFFTGAAGALLAHQIGTIAPRAYYFTTTFTIIIMVVLGGLGSVSGAVIGATVMTLAPEYLRGVEDGMTIGPIEIGEAFGLSQIILAIAFILVMIFRPQGIFGDRELSFHALRRRKRANIHQSD